MAETAAGPSFELSLRYVCGCVDQWMVYTAPDEAHTTLDVPCVPEHCQTCERDGICSARAGMPLYQPVEWAEVAAGGPKRYRRL